MVPRALPVGFHMEVRVCSSINGNLFPRFCKIKQANRFFWDASVTARKDLGANLQNSIYILFYYTFSAAALRPAKRPVVHAMPWLRPAHIVG